MRHSIRIAIGSGVAMLGLLASPFAAGASATSHPGMFTCSGGTSNPFNPSIIPPGSYDRLSVTGTCLIPGGQVDVAGNLTVGDGAVLVANFPASPSGPEDDAILNVGGNIDLGSGATLIMGCAPSFGCANTTSDGVGGNLRATGALGAVLHAVTIAGNLTIKGGGGQDFACRGAGGFAAFGSPVFSTLDDGAVNGNFSVSGYQSCWLGFARDTIGGNVTVKNNALGDPDAIEILSNTISGNLSCSGNQFVDVRTSPPTFSPHPPFDSTEAPNGDLFPRQPEPNTVFGQRKGDCVLASPVLPGLPPGPGPF